MSRAVVLLLERRLLFGEFGDAVEAGGDHQHLLLLFRIGAGSTVNRLRNACRRCVAAP
jgi:hypothetical protein